MPKLTESRRWVLSIFERAACWTYPAMLHAKKWRDQVEKAERAGELEADGCGLFRITDAGRAALVKAGEA